MRRRSHHSQPVRSRSLHRELGVFVFLQHQYRRALTQYKAAAVQVERVEAFAGSLSVVSAFMVRKPPSVNSVIVDSLPPQRQTSR